MASEQGWNLLVRSRKTGEVLHVRRTKSRAKRRAWMLYTNDLGEHGYQEVWDAGLSAPPVWQSDE